MSNGESLTYRTDDMSLAAYLMTQGATFEGLEPMGDRLYKFRLKCAWELAGSPQTYWSGKAMVEPMLYFTHLKRLKGEVARQGRTDRGGRS